MKEHRLGIRVDESTKDKLTKLADASNRKLSDYIRLVLEKAIKLKTKI